MTTETQEMTFWSKVKQWLKCAADKRVAYIQLERMTDRQLQDIGLYRGEIREKVGKIGKPCWMKKQLQS